MINFLLASYQEDLLSTKWNPIWENAISFLVEILTEAEFTSWIMERFQQKTVIDIFFINKTIEVVKKNTKISDEKKDLLLAWHLSLGLVPIEFIPFDRRSTSLLTILTNSADEEG